MSKLLLQSGDALLLQSGDALLVAPAGIKSLLTAWWDMEEASGDRTDANGVHDLANTNGVQQDTGKVGNAAEFVSASSHQLNLTSNLDDFEGDAGDFYFCGWVYFDTIRGTWIVSKWGSTANREYVIRYNTSQSRFEVIWYLDGGGSDVRVSADNFGAASIDTWYFLEAYKSGSTVGISVNRGTDDTVSGAVSGNAGSSPFRLGNEPTVSNTQLNGRLDSVGVWRRTMTTDERDALYNSGDGVAFSDLDTAIVIVTGQASITLDGVSATSSASSEIAAQSSITLDGVSGAASASSSVEGVSGVTLDGVVATATGSQAITSTGAASIALDGVVASSTATVAISASTTIVMDGVSVSSSGSQSATTGSGSVSIALDGVTANALATSAVEGESTILLDGVTVTTTNVEPPLGSLDLSIFRDDIFI